MQSKMNADNSKTETYNFITKHNRQMSTPDLRNIDKLNVRFKFNIFRLFQISKESKKS